MLQLSLALLSKNCTPYFLASASPSALETCLSESATSDLLPTMILEMLSGWLSLICLIQFSRLLKVFLSLTAQTRITPAAPLQQVSVIVLNLSWPAVSQICILIFTPSMSTVLILKSTPMVVICVILYYQLTYRSKIFVFPTALSPMITTFTKQSYFSYYFLRAILLLPFLTQVIIIENPDYCIICICLISSILCLFYSSILLTGASVGCFEGAGWVLLYFYFKYPQFYIQYQLLVVSMKALTLRSSITKPSLITRSGFTTGRVGVAFLLAGLITTANWFIQGELTEADNTRANEIIKRVTDKKTVSVTDLQNYTQASELEGSLVQVKGELLDGRFVVKRSRGGQEGYIILAPFSVSRRQYQYDLSQKSLNEKYMLNLGWVPKQSKHTIRETAAVDVLEFDQLPEELASEEEPPAFLTVTAYVRRGEEQDILRGYRNWLRQKLFKYVDLPFLANMYCAANKSFNYIYLDRVAEEGSADAFPFPNTQEHYVDQMRQEIAYNNKRKQQLSYGVGIASFATAAITCLL